MEEVQSEGASWIIHAIVGDAGGQERAGRRQFGVLAPKTQNRLRKIQSRWKRISGPSLGTGSCGTYHTLSAFCLGSVEYSRENLELELIVLNVLRPGKETPMKIIQN